MVNSCLEEKNHQERQRPHWCQRRWRRCWVEVCGLWACSWGWPSPPALFFSWLEAQGWQSCWWPGGSRGRGHGRPPLWWSVCGAPPGRERFPKAVTKGRRMVVYTSTSSVALMNECVSDVAVSLCSWTVGHFHWRTQAACRGSCVGVKLWCCCCRSASGAPASASSLEPCWGETSPAAGSIKHTQWVLTPTQMLVQLCQ